MKPGKVRTIAICIFSHNGRILVAKGFDHEKKLPFYRPLGGTIEFGELGKDTIQREILEELGKEIANIRYVGTLESIFTYNGEKGHEIVLIYDGEFKDQTLYNQIEMIGVEGNTPLMAVWRSKSDFSPSTPLYPEGIIDLLPD